jgi:hypothetical protein
MESILPDVNTAFNKCRNAVEAGIAAKDWDKVLGNLYAWNALFPLHTDENGIPLYQVKVSDLAYAKLTESKSNAICPLCGQETDYDDVHIFDKTVPILMQALTKQKTIKVWICPKCHKDSKITETVITETELVEPSFLRTVPKPPKRKDGLNDRGSFDRRMTQWAYSFKGELERSSAQFRADYKPADKSMMDWTEDFDGGEEE